MSESYIEDFIDRLPELIVDWLKENNYVIQYGEVVPASRSKHSNTPSEIKEYADKLVKEYADEVAGAYRGLQLEKELMLLMVLIMIVMLMMMMKSKNIKDLLKGKCNKCRKQLHIQVEDS